MVTNLLLTQFIIILYTQQLKKEDFIELILKLENKFLFNLKLWMAILMKDIIGTHRYL